MKNQDFTISFTVSQSPHEVFSAITSVRAWWSEELEGNSEKLNDEFSYHHGDIHYSTHKLVEVEQDKKVVWLTTNSKLNFVRNQDEWNGTKVIFEVFEEEDETKLVVTHSGLVPELECYDACSKAWTNYLQDSLVPLITTGTGNPDKRSQI